MTTGAVAGCATATSARPVTKTPFAVPGTTIPIAGSEIAFPVQ